jgi:hypothetical protein
VQGFHISGRGTKGKMAPARKLFFRGLPNMPLNRVYLFGLYYKRTGKTSFETKSEPTANQLKGMTGIRSIRVLGE